LASASPIDGLVSKTFRFKAERFLRWKRKQPKAKPKFVQYGAQNKMILDCS
jgi:hypothetical protein